jgi:serine/threonine protein phosphatase PrpC
MHIHYAGLSDTGRKRERNEDCFAVHEKIHLAILCDGMGGHNAGNVASRLIVDTVAKVFHEADDECIERICSDLEDPPAPEARRLIASVRLANHRVHALAGGDRRFKGMGSTLVAVHFFKSHLAVCHVGDSRLYFSREGRLEQMTADHSLLNQLLQANAITNEEAKHFGRKNVITRALGFQPKVQIDLKTMPIQRNDLFLLCSDGLTSVVDDGEIGRILSNPAETLDAKPKILISEANRKGGPDNITVVLAGVAETDSGPDRMSETKTTVPEENERISSIEDECLKTWFGRDAAFE